VSIDWASLLREAEKKMVSAKLPPTWKPDKPGDILYGIVVDVQPNPWDKTVTSLIIRTPDGKELMTPRNQTLTSLIDRLQPQVGDAVVIRYDGEGVKKPGRNPPKIFSMYVKKLAEKPAEISEEEVEEMEREIETAGEVEEKFESQPEVELESAKSYVLREVLPIYGTVHKNKLDKLLRQKGYKVTSEDLLDVFGSEFTVDKYGYIQKRGEK
jgi:hypothetical protein